MPGLRALGLLFWGALGFRVLRVPVEGVSIQGLLQGHFKGSRASFAGSFHGHSLGFRVLFGV